jgi:1,4-alpha-glucan branching enzyme
MIGPQPHEKPTELSDAWTATSIWSDFDLYLFGQSKDYYVYKKFGAHVRVIDGVAGVNFSVWAPDARSVAVIGNFNYWDRSTNPMRLRHHDLGVWECFIPGLQVGEVYKYFITSYINDYTVEKADPYAFAAELPSRTGSIVSDIHQHQWQDQDWMQARKQFNPLSSPVSTYELHVGSWRHIVDEFGPRPMTYRELAHALAPYIKELGFTHVELMPITEFPYEPSWGYQVTGYFAPTSRYGTPQDFQYFVDYLHQQGIGIILDWVPGHFPKDLHGLSYFDGTHLYEYADPRKGEHKEWGTYVFDYGRTEVRNFLFASAVFWLTEYHLDGLRVDAVASILYLDYAREPGEWIPNQYGGRENLEAVSFLRQLNEATYSEQPGTFTVAEESTAWPLVSRPTYIGGLGFGLKWNMGWMHDMLEYMQLDSIYRRYHQSSITFSLMYAYNENFVLPLSHDEVVYGKRSLLSKMPGDVWQRFANLRAFFGYMWGHPGKKLLFMGGEFGQWREWDYTQSLDWNLLDPGNESRHALLHDLVRDLNQLYQREPALSVLDVSPRGFSWIDLHDSDNSVVSFMRRGKNAGEELIFVCNFTPVLRYGYRIGVPAAGDYYEVINTDAWRYGGSGVENTNMMPSGPMYWQSFPNSIQLTLPPLATVILKYRPFAQQTDPK